MRTDVQRWCTSGARSSTLLGLGLLCGCNEVSFSKENDEFEEPVELVETFVQSPLPQMDILWVIDDSPSMEQEQVALQESVESLMSELEASEIAWQMGVLAADLGAESAGVLLGDPWIITPSIDDPLTALRSALDVGIDGRGASAGLGVVTLALSEPLVSEDNRGFRRPDASLHIIVFSDTDDQSTGLLGEDPATSFLAFLAQEASANDRDARLSAIVGDSGFGCIGMTGAALPGETYIEVANESGGSTGSICNTDFGNVLATMGAESISWPVRFVLQAEPVPDSIRISVDGSRLDAGWWLELEPSTIVFDIPPGPGVIIEVQYEIAP